MQSTFTFKQFIIAEFRQARFRHWSMSKFDKLCRNPAMFSNRRRIPVVQCQMLARLAEIWLEPPDLRLSGWIRLFWPKLQPSGWDTGRIPASWPESSQDRRLPVNCWDPTVLCQIPAKIAGFRHKWPDSGHVCRNLYEKYFYIILY
jgi:hypothetical protein